MPTTRFAPSPTGLLHLGHALSALFAAQAAGPHGTMLLRIEDIDRTRCKPDFTAAIFEDLRWLGLSWPEPVRAQSAHFHIYAQTLDQLKAAALVYPCFCTRSAIRRELVEMFGAPHLAPGGPDGPLYPGTCRTLSETERRDRIAAGEAHAWRLDMARATAVAGPLDWIDLDRGLQRAQPERLGDVVLARKDVPTSYHLAVTLDDALQEIELVTRGEDLRPAADLHRLLQALLDLPVPRWQHHRLLTDAEGKRLAKRDGAPSLAGLRADGITPDAVRALVGLPGG